ncbi:hypothetical protein ADUPG1_000174, partial [Aduncisulcus paluster]
AAREEKEKQRQEEEKLERERKSQAKRLASQQRSLSGPSKKTQSRSKVSDSSSSSYFSAFHDIDVPSCPFESIRRILWHMTIVHDFSTSLFAHKLSFSHDMFKSLPQVDSTLSTSSSVISNVDCSSSSSSVASSSTSLTLSLNRPHLRSNFVFRSFSQPGCAFVSSLMHLHKRPMIEMVGIQGEDERNFGNKGWHPRFVDPVFIGEGLFIDGVKADHPLVVREEVYSQELGDPSRMSFNEFNDALRPRQHGKKDSGEKDLSKESLGNLFVSLFDVESEKKNSKINSLICKNYATFREKECHPELYRQLKEKNKLIYAINQEIKNRKNLFASRSIMGWSELAKNECLSLMFIDLNSTSSSKGKKDQSKRAKSMANALTNDEMFSVLHQGALSKEYLWILSGICILSFAFRSSSSSLDREEGAEEDSSCDDIADFSVFSIPSAPKSLLNTNKKSRSSLPMTITLDLSVDKSIKPLDFKESSSCVEWSEICATSCDITDGNDSDYTISVVQRRKESKLSIYSVKFKYKSSYDDVIPCDYTTYLPSESAECFGDLLSMQLPYSYYEHSFSSVSKPPGSFTKVGQAYPICAMEMLMQIPFMSKWNSSRMLCHIAAQTLNSEEYDEIVDMASCYKHKQKRTPVRRQPKKRTQQTTTRNTQKSSSKSKDSSSSSGSTSSPEEKNKKLPTSKKHSQSLEKEAKKLLKARKEELYELIQDSLHLDGQCKMCGEKSLSPPSASSERQKKTSKKRSGSYNYAYNNGFLECSCGNRVHLLCHLKRTKPGDASIMDVMQTSDIKEVDLIMGFFKKLGSFKCPNCERKKKEEEDDGDEYESEYEEYEYETSEQEEEEK